MWLRDTPVATDAAIFFFFFFGCVCVFNSICFSTLVGLWKMVRYFGGVVENGDGS